MESGQLLKVVATDTGSLRTQAFAKQTGNELVHRKPWATSSSTCAAAER
jgi:TusA-related sulfurtransferase